MATIVHDTFRDGLLGDPLGTTTTVDLIADTIKVDLVDGADLSSPAGPPAASWDDYADINQATAVVATQTLASKTVGAGDGLGIGIFDAADVTFTSVTGDSCEHLVMYKDAGGAEANDPLIITWDSATTGIPVTPNGGDIVVTWAGGGILSI